MMWRVTVLAPSLKGLLQEEHTHENVVEYSFGNGVLALRHADDSRTIYNQGSWREADVERIPEGDYQV